MLNRMCGLIGQLLGSLLGWIFEKLLMPLLEWVLSMVFEYIVTPVLYLVFRIIAYTIGYIGYVIGSFILKLIDFVEILFRALAGLESTNSNVGMSIKLSLDGDTGDILLQLIRNQDIQQAFLSMCIVGLFLLLVTTVFQIIKVEYTTEGAKNSKTPILQKAFKGLANLMLLPLLVVFGIVFANQLLGLLDKATTVEGSNPTISGLIFVASASDAHYYEDETIIDMEGAEKGIISGSMKAIKYAIKDFTDNLGTIIKEKGWTPTTEGGEFAEIGGMSIDEIEKNFISQNTGFKYYNIAQVSKYYNYSAINYLLLLFGGVFVLKCLFFTCFGMVIRLYKCAILFIIAPVVIGMTPINEGGLGKWRTSFIGQVLAAYGTVLSINLFFVVVRVLLNIKVEFTIDNVGENTQFLGSSFMTMLLQCIFVLAGVLLIEKFSKELGGYFGAEDAMGAGKDMANQVGDLAMKGVGAAAMVATGGASLAMKAGKAAGGIAGKIGQSGIGQAVGGLGKKVGGKLKTVGGKVGDWGLDVVDSIGETKVGKAGKAIGGFVGKVGKGVGNIAGTTGAWLAHGKMGVDQRRFKNADAAASRAFAKYEKADKEIKDLEERDAKGGITIAETRKLNRLRKERDGYEKTFNEQHDASIEAKSGHSDKDWNSFADKRASEQAAARTKRNNRKLEMQNMVEGFAIQGRKNMWGSKYTKQFDDAAAAGAKELGGQHETAHNDIIKSAQSEKQDMARDANKKTIGQLNADAAFLLSINATQELQHSMERLSKDMTKSIEQLASIISSKGITDSAKDQYKLNTLNNLQAQGANIDLAQLDKLVANAGKDGQKFSVDLKNDLKIDFDPKSIKDAVMKAMREGANTPDEIKKAVMSALDNVKDSALLKMISDIIEKHISNLGK